MHGAQTGERQTTGRVDGCRAVMQGGRTAADQDEAQLSRQVPLEEVAEVEFLARLARL